MKAPSECMYCDHTDPNCGFCDMGKPLDTQEDWDASWGRTSDLIEGVPVAESSPIQTESILRKILRGGGGWDHMYVDTDNHSICLDGWSDNLTDDELDLVRQLASEERS